MKSVVSETQVCDCVLFVLVIDGLYLFLLTSSVYSFTHIYDHSSLHFLSLHACHFLHLLLLLLFSHPCLSLYFSTSFPLPLKVYFLCGTSFVLGLLAFTAMLHFKLVKVKALKIRKYLTITANFCKCIINSAFLPFMVCVCVCPVQSARSVNNELYSFSLVNGGWSFSAWLPTAEWVNSIALTKLNLLFRMDG